MARESMSLRPNSLKASIILILLLYCGVYYLTQHILHVYDMESPDEGIRITINVHIESNRRPSDLQHSTLTTVPIGEVYRPKLLCNT